MQGLLTRLTFLPPLLLVPCRFTMYRLDWTVKAGGAASDGGKIVAGVADFMQEADTLSIHRRQAATIAAKG